MHLTNSFYFIVKQQSSVQVWPIVELEEHLDSNQKVPVLQWSLALFKSEVFSVALVDVAYTCYLGYYGSTVMGIFTGGPNNKIF